MLASERGEPAPLGRRARHASCGASRLGCDIPVEPPPSLGEAWRTVWKIGVLRRIFIALPVPRRLHRRLHLPGLAAVPADVPPRRGPARLPHRADPGLRPPRPGRRGRRSPPGWPPATSASSSACSPWPRSSPPAFAVLFALAPNVPSPSSATPASTRRSPSSGPASWPRSRWPSRPGCARSASPSAPSSSCPGSSCSRSSVRIGDAVGFRYGLLILVPIFVVGGLIVASAGGLIERDVQDVWTSMRTRTQMLRGPPGRPAPAPRRARARRRLRRRRGARRRRDRGRRGRDRRAASAPTGPASRPCCGPSAASSRPTTAPSSSTAATSPICRPTRSPASASPRCPAARASSPTSASRRTCGPRPGRAGGGASATPT